jgi:hypothetical protein
VGYTTDRELHPAPKVFIWLLRLYPAEHKLHNSLAPSARAGVCPRAFYISVRFDNAIDWADGYALGRIVMTFALNAGFLINNIQNAIAFTDRFSRALRDARAAGDAVFSNFHGHGYYSFKVLLLRL